MLERQCLKAGLQCSQRPPRPLPSKRTLHHAFWLSGAGDIDRGQHQHLPPWALPPTTPASHPPPPDNPPPRSVKPPMRRGTDTLPDGIFLDFLYPPQALAWLHRANSYGHGHAQQWERRNARRLPEGFVQASRGYSSSSYAPFTSPRAQTSDRDAKKSHGGVDEKQEWESWADSVEMETQADGESREEPHELDTATEVPSEEAASQTSEGDAQEPRHGVYEKQGLKSRADSVDVGTASSRGLSDKPYEFDTVAEASSEGEAAQLHPAQPDDNPGDLPDVVVDELPVEDAILPTSRDPKHDLLAILRKERVPYELHETTRAWTLYNLLDEDDRMDLRLKDELMAWLNVQENEIANAHCISLYWSIPVDKRQLTIYKAALSAYLKRGDLDAAFGLHKEALENIPNGAQVSKDLVAYAMDTESWEMLRAIIDQHHQVFAGPSQANQRELLWLSISEMPNLVRGAVRLAERCISIHYQTRHDKTQYDEVSLGTCSAPIFREALYRLSRKPLPPLHSQLWQHANHHSRILADAVRRWSAGASEILEASILSLLQQHQTREEFPKAYHILSRMYRRYRRSPDFRPSKRILKDLIFSVLEYDAPFREERKTVASVDLWTLGKDWRTAYGKLESDIIRRLIQHYARLGDAHRVAKWFAYLQRSYPEYQDQQGSFHSLVYVHARRADTRLALRSFRAVQAIAHANNDDLNDMCWNALLHAYSRANDLDGAISIFNEMMDANVTLTQQSVHPILQLMADRGDADGVYEFLKKYIPVIREEVGRMPTSFIGSQMTALVKSGQIKKAEDVLKSAVRQKTDLNLSGSLRGCFNIMLTAYALKLDLDATMRTYRWMQQERISMDTFTYSALIQALVRYRQPDAAWKILTTLMPQEKMRPKALHFAIIMNGYVNRKTPVRALDVHKKMVQLNILPTLATRKGFLTAKAHYELEKWRKTSGDMIEDLGGSIAPLEVVIDDLRRGLQDMDASEIADKQPAYGYDTGDTTTAMGAFIAPVMFLHGSGRCFQAVEEMFRQYKAELSGRDQGTSLIPMELLTALLVSNTTVEKYDEVDAYWKLAKEQADSIASSTVLDNAQRLLRPPSDENNVETPSQGNDSNSQSSFDRAEIGFMISKPDDEAQKPMHRSEDNALGPRPSSGQQYVLTRPTRFYLQALSSQGRIDDMIDIFTQLLRQGYVFDMITWNRFIRHLCTADPPRVLLAFQLTERFLIDEFPGWKESRWRPRPASVGQQLQHIRARYVHNSVLMPQYPTMVHLASAYLHLRRREARGVDLSGKGAKAEETRRLVGTSRQVEEQAPRTLAYCNAMPHVDDTLQNRHLRGIRR